MSSGKHASDRTDPPLETDGALSFPEFDISLEQWDASHPLTNAVVQPDEWPESHVGSEALSIEFLRNHHVLPINLTDDGLHLAMADVANDFAAKAVRVATGQTVVRRKASRDSILSAIDRVERSADQPPTNAVDTDVETISDNVEHLRDLALGTPVVRIVNALFRDALRARATDIHIEPFDGQLVVRFRVDGLLHEVPGPATNLAAAVVSRIKILAGLDIAEHRLPQDGRTTVHVEGHPVDVRIATMPAIHGESVVLRLLDNNAGNLDFETLGFNAQDIRAFKTVLDAPHGLIIVTGPTGSGKTTTLATALKYLNQSHRKILTIEDPVEYELNGVNQTQVKPEIGLTFSKALRGFLRHDPDVIMVGEMRDAETARIGVHAALTGHLVLTTLHTNTAAGAIVRLLDMGIDAYLLASTLRCVVGQRLVRRLCQNCCSDASDYEESLPVGCNECQQTGYKGRLALSEFLNVDKELSSLIKPDVSEIDISAAARARGMKTMLEDGALKCRNGVTTRDDVRRVTLDV